jgi:alpha-tubulin suppressor-like RCC1 family protein
MTSTKHPEELPRIPELADEYELVRELGRGGTAVVYLARDRELGRDVAIKLIRPSFIHDEDAVSRLIREARTVGKLQHPNIVMLLGTRRLSDGGLALILQYVPGRSLKDRIRAEGPLPFEECEQILFDVAQALTHAHRSRIVHRDLKPENVYLDEGLGIARLADFGIARAWDSDSGLTLPGTAIGTPSYMSPEQVDGRELDGRSDLYSLGLLGYEMLTGRQPWEGESLYAVIFKQKNEELPPITSLRPGTPANLIHAIEGAVRKDPADRWRDAQAFLEALTTDSEIPEREGSASPPPAPWHSEPTPEADATTVAPAAAAGWTPALPGGGPPADAPFLPEGPPGAPGGGRVGRTPGRGSGRLGIAAVAVLVVGLLVTAGLGLAGPEGGILGLFGPEEPTDFRTEGPRATEDPRTPESGFEPVTPTFSAIDSPSSPDDGRDPDLAGLAWGVDADGQPRAFAVVAGDGQRGPAGAELSVPLVLRMVDRDENPVRGMPVTFEVMEGGGTADPVSDVTRPDGSILTRWTLGPGGPQRLRATAMGMEEVAYTFEATVSAAVAASLALLGSASPEGVAGAPLPGSVSVRVLDATGTPVEGLPVRFQPAEGAGSTDPATAITDAAGVAASRWTLGTTTGGQELMVQVVGAPQLTTRIEARVGPPRLPVRSGLALGGSHACLLRSNGTVACWGGNESAQLGDGSRNRRLAPVGSLAEGPFAVVASGVSHACGLTPEGETWCWGSNDQGQSGAPAGGVRSTPASVQGAPRFTALAAGLAHTCGLTRSGEAWCWGGNGAGQLGDGTLSARTEPVQVNGDIAMVALAAGWQHTCGLDGAGRAFCWGNGMSGQLGHGASTGAVTPQAVQGGQRFRTLAAGNAHTCGLTTGGRILCWGSNEFGQLGTGSAGGGVSTVPLTVAGDRTFGGLAVGGVHACGLDGDGAAFCWGRNLHGQVGDGTTEDRPAPTRVEGSIRFIEVASLGSHTCGRTAGGEVHCWGYNLEGQLGDGSRQNRLSPVPVVGTRP